jgi:CheY-like chemotaxis protein
MNGYDVVRQFRASPDLASLFVIATTGYGRDEDRARCLAAGFNHHLAKPVDIDVIEALVTEAD